ncbi:MAG: hypothetical protein IPG92_04160 [Flavobacteriales bacterium]|nr:hypothetical protein [Flavobacteriales bacterium]
MLEKGVSLETSSAYDIEIVELMIERGKLPKDATILCNGYKDDRYIRNIARLANSGFQSGPHHRQHGRTQPAR